MGVCSVWIGFEGMQAGYDKQKGKSYDQLFTELKSVGIAPAASMIIGFDYQTVEIIEREYAELLRLKPAISQFLIYGPTRGSPLYERKEKEGKLNDVVKTLYPMMDGFTLGFDHPNISAPTLKLLSRQLYRGEYQFLGPTVYRTMEIALQGYRNLKDATEPRLQIRAQMQQEFLRNAQAANRIGIVFAPNNLVRARVETLFDDIERELGPAPPLQEAESYLVLALGAWTKLKFSVNGFSQTASRRHVYNFEEKLSLGDMPHALASKIAGAIPDPFAPPPRHP